MSKLLEDPKIAALVAKHEAIATKVATKAHLATIKSAIETNKENEDKIIKKAVAAVLKGIMSGIKESV